MGEAAVSKLGCALLGLLQQNPASGYSLRKIFSTTAMCTYSDSPGAIYPALRRLLQQGFIRGSIERGAGLRRRQVFRLTQQGAAELKIWITRPLVRADVIRGLDEVMLRFAFCEQAIGSSASVRLLKSLQAELTEYIPALHQQLSAGTRTMPTSGRLALEYGIKSYESLLQWSRHAIATYEHETKSKPRKKEESLRNRRSKPS